MPSATKQKPKGPNAFHKASAEFRAATTSASGAKLIYIHLHEGQQYLWDKLLSSPARFISLLCHRRWGKNWLCIADMMEQKKKLLQKDRSQLNPAVVVWFVFPTYLLADELWRDLKRMIPNDQVLRISNSKPYEMELKDGTFVSIRSAENPDHLVSAGIDLLYMIEAARMKESAWLTVRPTLVSHQRLGRVVFNSTPKGQNWYANLHRYCMDHNSDSWVGITIPAYEPDGSRNKYSIMPTDEKLEEERQSYPSRWFRQEYLCDILTGEGAVFRPEVVRARVAPAPNPPVHPLYCGVDLAKHSDYSVFSIFDGEGRMVDLQRMNQVDYTVQCEFLISLLAKWRVKKAVIEGNGPGDPFYDMLLRDLHTRRLEFQGQPQLVAFQTTAQSKRQMIDSLVVAFERGLITILDDEELINEFEAFEMTQTTAGNTRYAAPEGGWDDRVMSCALAWTEIAAKMMNKPKLISSAVHNLGNGIVSDSPRSAREAIERDREEGGRSSMVF